MWGAFLHTNQFSNSLQIPVGYPTVWFKTDITWSQNRLRKSEALSHRLPAPLQEPVVSDGSQGAHTSVQLGYKAGSSHSHSTQLDTLPEWHKIQENTNLHLLDFTKDADEEVHRVRSGRAPSPGASSSLELGCSAIQACGCAHRPEFSPAPPCGFSMEVSSLSQEPCYLLVIYTIYCPRPAWEVRCMEERSYL